MFYHQGLERIILLNCYERGQVDVPIKIWGWNGQGWDVLEDEGPPGRDLAGVAYDSRRERIVLYGGLFLGQPDCSRETWEWDGSDWQQIAVGSPGPCNHAKMTYDAARGVSVLFGGQKEALVGLAETWTWDGAVWQQIETSAEATPVSRAHFGFVFDPDRDVTYLYGGYNGRALGDFWAWDGTAWQESDKTGPGVRSHAAMARDGATGALVLFGGARSSSSFTSLTDQTWVFHDDAWTEATPATAPPLRGLATMAYDPQLKQMLLYGGFIRDFDYADTWAWDGSNWSCRAACP